MLVAQYFVEFIFYSFLGWVWESIYCTIKEKKWADRGFLFGPICPIYGSCVVGATIVFTSFSRLSDPDFPIWGTFILCFIGSAIAEFMTSWILEKRFHARWWDYSNIPLNIQGRICFPVSLSFGVAGVLITKYLIPVVLNLRTSFPPLGYEILALILAAVFGADYALTEVSLSHLLNEVENMHKDFNEKAQENYEKIVRAPEIFRQKVQFEVNSIEEKVNREKKLIGKKLIAWRVEEPVNYIKHMTLFEKRAVTSIIRMTPLKNKTADQNNDRQLAFEGIKNALTRNKK